jgi:type II secretory pathway predicted ATPase ExeA/outer membrane protein OmpA-like peptidoglycan-associated protein
MYLEHFGLKLKPFNISPDPHFLWLGERHKEALATLKYGIQEDKGFLLLTGDVGTGKTVLINRLIKHLDLKVIVATIPDPGLGLIDFYNILADEFKMGRTFTQKGDFLIHFKKFLVKAYGEHKNVLLIIDEAQRLKPGLLDEVRVLSNIDLQGRKLINIFLVGQTELKEMLLEEKNRPFRQRISVNYNIEPLNAKETAAFIEHRLKVAGATRRYFTADAMREVHTFSNGFPRLINVICDHALMSGYSAGVTMIDGSIIKECAKELRIADDPVVLPLKEEVQTPYKPPVYRPAPIEYHETPEEPPKVSFIRIAGFLLIGIFFIGFVFSLFRTSEPEQPPELAKLDTKTAVEKSVAEAETEQPAEIANSEGETEDVPETSAPSENRDADDDTKKLDLDQKQSDQDSNINESGAMAQNEALKDETPAKEIIEDEQAEVDEEIPAEDEASAKDIIENEQTGVDEETPAEQAATGTATPESTIEEVEEKKITAVAPDIASNNQSQEIEPAESLEPQIDEEESLTAALTDQEATPQKEPLSLVLPGNKLLIYFGRDSTEIDSEHLEVLSKVADYLVRASDLIIIVEGYTDSYGNLYYNENLSQLRANMVKSYFVGQGVDNSRINAIGLGPENPIGDNQTREGRKKNRRVEVRVVPAE